LVKTLKASNAKLIWASTTPVPDGAAGRIRGDDVRYNAIAAKVMKRRHVPANDLYAAVIDGLASYQLPANVHFSEVGSAFLAKHVVAAILEALGK
jgi:acyl-CoA thioesterase-1